MNESTKQVIVMRKDLNMRKGKMIAQGSHASMSFLTKNGQFGYHKDNQNLFYTDDFSEDARIQITQWLNNSFRKITVYVNSSEELVAVHQKALDAGLISHLIIDNGTTEFNGVPTLTCCAIGPHWDSKFEGITDHLPLL
jgi:PTH2 family peptidyl-tRNA hydrolase